MIRFTTTMRRTIAALTTILVLAVLVPLSSAKASSTIPPEVQKTVGAILDMQDPKNPAPDKAMLDAFLAYSMSPLNLAAADGKAPHPEKIGKATGILWRSRINTPLSTVLQYLYNPKVPNEVVYPASIRRARWQPGSDILSLSAPLWEQFGKHKDAPLVLRGTEQEEITPDTFSGAYYKYLLDRVLILTEFEGKQVLVSLSMQKGKSDVGKKAAHIGDYEEWDFIYSGAAGTLAKGIGWADTFIYSSASIAVFYEDAPGGKITGYAMYRWMDAGWSGMNMVKDHHIVSGAERSFKGLWAFLESPKRPAPDVVASYVASLEALDIAALREWFHPYSVRVEESAASVPALKTDDFQKIIKDAGYGNSLTKDEIISAMSINFIKQQLGKPLLAGPLNGPLNGKGAAASVTGVSGGAPVSSAGTAR